MHNNKTIKSILSGIAQILNPAAIAEAGKSSNTPTGQNKTQSGPIIPLREDQKSLQLPLEQARYWVESKSAAKYREIRLNNPVLVSK